MLLYTNIWHYNSTNHAAEAHDRGAATVPNGGEHKSAPKYKAHIYCALDRIRLSTVQQQQILETTDAAVERLSRHGHG